MKRKLLSLLVTSALVMSLPGCGSRPEEPVSGSQTETPEFSENRGAAVNLMAAVERGQPVEPIPLETEASAVTDFGVRLLQKSLHAEDNTLISPLSVLCALAMTANGARGETLNQMQNVLGLDTDTLNSWIYTYMQQLPQEDRYRLSLANSIWVTEDENFAVVQDFLRTNADYYGADIYRTVFDEAACKEINGWVEGKTDGMIRDILDEIPEHAVMYLINALAFEAEWQEIYHEHQIREGIFTKEDGTAQEAELMWSGESRYLEDAQATGFLKYYADRKYAFAALLPNEGVSVAEYTASLTGEHLHELLMSPAEKEVRAAIPRFESEYTAEMSEILQTLGMTDAFDVSRADFSGLGSYTGENVLIDRVIHKTYINVDAKGTKAGAATVVEMVAKSAAMPIEEPKTVILDRPFVYMLIDCENAMPFFIGTVMEVG